jgi:signal transduction histidine kinase
MAPISELDVERPGRPHLMRRLETARGDRRFIVNQPAQLSVPGASGEIWQARIRDISRGGMQFVTDRPVDAGPRVVIAWNGRELEGVIRYQQAHGEEFRLGVELNGSWDTLVSDVLAQQADELAVSATALVKANRELAVALEIAREASEAKSRFLASVSHELRTPLNGIIGFSQLLHDGGVGPVTPAQKDCLGDVLNCSGHLLSLIDHVLDLTKIESGKMDFDYETVCLEDAAAAAISDVRAIAVVKRLDLTLAVEPGMAPVQADAAKLRQVLLNYLSNALKFTPQGGSIRVEVSRHDSASYRVQVEDTGIGIEAADLPRLFMEFGQVGASGKTRKGTGLGLVITKRLVEAQGGSVGVESTPGRGSRFFAVLPSAPRRG